MRQIIVGTRGSTVALAQARWVVARLKEEWPDSDFRIQTVASQADMESGMDLEQALIQNKIDIAIHDLKDFGLNMPEGLELASITKRIDARDALVGRAGMKHIKDLPDGTVLGVSNRRQLAFIKAQKPKLVFEQAAGSLDARLDALGKGDFDALVVAASDLIRMELRNRIDELIDPNFVMPAPGQGSLGLQTRIDDDLAIEAAYSLNDRDSDDRVTAERAFLEGVASQKNVAVGALALLKDGLLKLEGWLAAQDGSKLIQASIEGEPDECEELGFELAQDILKQRF
ncbi:MAG: hydroxymethylbilane synthase [Deinococcaceae bacterium]